MCACVYLFMCVCVLSLACAEPATKPQAGVLYREEGSLLTVQTQPMAPASKDPQSSHPLTANSACHLMWTTQFINYGELRGHPTPVPQLHK